MLASRPQITLASDAHVPANVGRDFDRAVEFARAAGYETVTVFERRRARQEPLG
jgi:histidinol-phosphatase (PHP family)